MELRRAVLGGHGQLAGGAPAVLRGVVGDQQFDFADGIDRRVDVAGVEVTGVLAGGAVHVEDDLALLSAVDARDAAAVPAAVVARRSGLHARQRHDEADRVASARRRVFNLLQPDGDRTVRAVRRDVYGRALHFHRAGHFADGQVELVQVDAFLRRHRDALLIVAFEARLYDMQAICTRNEAGENERAVRLGDKFAYLLREIVGQLHRGARNDCARGVHHGSRNLAGNTLAVNCRQRCQQTDQHRYNTTNPLHELPQNVCCLVEPCGRTPAAVAKQTSV